MNVSPLSKLHLFGSLLLLGSAQLTTAQEPTLLVASVNADGTLINSANTANGTVSASRSSEGVYQIEIESVGAFAGLTEDHIIPHATILQAPFNDEVASAHVSAVSSDEVQIIVRTADAEDALIPGVPAASDSSFYLVVNRTAQKGAISAGSRYLLASGVVNSAGALVRSLGIDGITVSSSREGLGNYTVSLNRPGTFIDDSTISYVLLLQSTSVGGDQDQGVRGLIESVNSHDEVVFRVGIEDLQDDTNHDFAFPVDRHFFFTVYRIPSSPSNALPDSKLFLFAAKVDINGNILSASSAEENANISSSRVFQGAYVVSITRPGLFASPTPPTIIVHSQVNHSLISDEVSIASFVISDENTGTASITINDVESAGQTAGVPEDRAFSVLVYRGDAQGRSDLRVGKKNRLSRMKGNGIYSASGSKQRVTARGKGNRPIRSFFAADNDGNVVDNFVFRAAGSKKHLKTKYFRLGGGRQNITAKTKGAGYHLTGLRPDQAARFATKSRFRSHSTKRRSQFRIRANSQLSPGSVDTGKVKVKRGT